jgi:hypothetical protein
LPGASFFSLRGPSGERADARGRSVAWFLALQHTGPGSFRSSWGSRAPCKNGASAMGRETVTAGSLMYVCGHFLGKGYGGPGFLSVEGRLRVQGFRNDQAEPASLAPPKLIVPGSPLVCGRVWGLGRPMVPGDSWGHGWCSARCEVPSAEGSTWAWPFGAVSFQRPLVLTPRGQLVSSAGLVVASTAF